MAEAATRTTAAAPWVATVADAMVRVGFDALGWLRRHGVAPSKLRDPDGRIPITVPVRLWRAAAGQMRSPALGLQVAAQIPTSVPIPFTFMAMTSATLRDLFESFERYQDLLSNARHMSLQRASDHDAVVLSSGGDPPLTSHQIDFHLALFVRICTFVVGPEFRALGVELEHAPPRDDAEYRQAFGCPLRFSQSRNALLIAETTMSSPSAYANPEVMRTLHADADRRMRELGPVWGSRVRAVLATQLPSGQASLAGIARRFGMASRTLQRHLTDEGLGFAQLVDEVRRAGAIERVEAGTLPLAEIARQLGFADARSFRRAFQRWTSYTPVAYRARLVRRAARA